MRSFFGAATGLLALSLGHSANSAPIYWNTWTSPTVGSLFVNGETVDIAFSTADLHDIFLNYPSWDPSTSFADGVVVDNGPTASNGAMYLTGGTSAVNRVTFSKQVVDPVMSVWSLGSPRQEAFYVFTNLNPILISGGANVEYGGSGLVVNGSTVSGVEGNGTIQFKGTYTEISWTVPDFEYVSAFNIGIATTVPEPATNALLIAGLALLVAKYRPRQ